jgi:hypothetical protein
MPPSYGLRSKSIIRTLKIVALLLFLPLIGLLSVASPAANPTTPAKGYYCWTANIEADLAGYKLAVTDTTLKVTTTDVGLTATPAAPCVVRDQTGQPDGNYSAQVFAYDRAGNLSAGSVTIPFVLDAAPPAAPAGLVVK